MLMLVWKHKLRLENRAEVAMQKYDIHSSQNIIEKYYHICYTKSVGRFPALFFPLADRIFTMKVQEVKPEGRRLIG